MVVSYTSYCSVFLTVILSMALIRKYDGAQIPVTRKIPMEPRYGGPELQSGPSPYKIAIDKEIVHSADKISVNIKTKSGVPFKGFYLQVKDFLNYTIGHFEPVKRVRLIDSCSQKNNVAIHDDARDKSSITLKWIAPVTLRGPIRFLLTIVKKWDEPWYFQQLENISVINAS